MSARTLGVFARSTILAAVLAGSTGCALVKRKAVGMVASTLASSGDVFTRDDDLELVGDAIPIEARIAAVADTFDAMTSVRPYRPGVPLPETFAELRRCSGAQFDPVCVTAFFDALDAGEIDLTPTGALAR